MNNVNIETATAINFWSELYLDRMSLREDIKSSGKPPIFS